VAISVAYRMQWRMSPQDLAAIRRAAEALPKKIRAKVVRRGLREWGNRLKLAIRRRVWRKDRDTRRDLAVKIKTYRRGKAIWCAVGVRKDGERVGWRSHFMDGGYRPWQKGMKADGTARRQPTRPGRNPNPRFVPFSYRRDWRKGKARRSLGGKIYRLRYMSDPAIAWSPKAREYVEDAIAEALMEASRGR